MYLLLNMGWFFFHIAMLVSGSVSTPKKKNTALLQLYGAPARSHEAEKPQFGAHQPQKLNLFGWRSFDVQIPQIQDPNPKMNVKRPSWVLRVKTKGPKTWDPVRIILGLGSQLFFGPKIPILK